MSLLLIFGQSEAVESSADVPAHGGGHGGKRRRATSGEHDDAESYVKRVMRSKQREAKDEPVTKMARVLRVAPKRELKAVKAVMPDRQKEAVSKLLDAIKGDSFGTEAHAAELEAKRVQVERAYAALLAVKEAEAKRAEAIEAEDAVVIELFVARRRKLAAAALAILQQKRAA